ncbi:MAG: DNA repair protein RadC [Deltaproteobacteria bacterium]|nr:DNA repair protein RadC [Deltaproteobacteria bacterium]
MTELPADRTDPRPRERLQALGPEALVDEELLALILGPCGAGHLAPLLLRRFGGLHGLERASASELVRIPGMGSARTAAVRAALQLGRRLALSEQPRGAVLRSADQIHRRLGPRLRHLRQENFVGIYLDARHRILSEQRIAEGGLTACAIHPREVLEPAVREAAAALIVAHNHPSGDPAPSADDLSLTRRLGIAAEALGVRLLDHLIIGDGRYLSLAEAGLLGGGD